VNDPVSAREALLIEAIGEVANLIDAVDRLTPELREASREIDRASEGLRASLAGFETQVLALTEKAKVQAVTHILARTDEAARRSIELQSRAMADAARVAFGAELGATVQRLQSLHERPGRRWEQWLTHAAAAATASAVTWMLAITPWAR
jgi:cell division septum initiation protein DivIVA